MDKARGVAAGLLAGFLLATVPAAAPAQGWTETIVREGVIEDDVYAGGAEVEIRADVAGDVVIAGGRISIDGSTAGDVATAGATVEIGGRVEDDVRAAGGTVTVRGEIGDDVAAGGATVRIVDGATVGGEAWLAAGRVAVAGTVGGDLRAAARGIVLSGKVGGNARLTADEITVLPSARIDGDLVYTSIVEAAIAPEAEIGGTITRYQAEETAGVTVFSVLGFSFLFLLGLIFAGVVLYLLFPNFMLSAGRTVGRHPWKSVALGFALLVLVPAAAIILCITLFGIPLGLALFLLYPVALALGYLTSAFFLGDAALRRIGRGAHANRGWQTLGFVVALTALWLLAGLPIVGTILMIATLLFGLGALGLRAYQAETRLSLPATAEE